MFAISKEKYNDAIKKRTELEHKKELTKEEIIQYEECSSLIDCYETENSHFLSLEDQNMEDEDNVMPDFSTDFDTDIFVDDEDTDLFDLMDDQNDYPQYSDWGI